LSSAKASVNQIVLQFTGALDGADATEAARYLVLVNGQAIEVESVAYSNNTVTLGLPEGSVAYGDTIVLAWQELHDAQQRLLPVSSQQLAVR
jgi:hypothetical protein